MQRGVLLLAACTLPRGTICNVQQVQRNVQEHSQGEDAQGRFCTQIGSSHDQCDAHPHKCQWYWYGDGHPDNGCAKTECFRKSKDACSASSRCVWKGSGRWKGLCIANNCGWRNDPRKCDTRPSNQCLFNHAFQACLPRPEQLSESTSSDRNPSSMWRLPWAPGSGTINVLEARDDLASLADPECSSDLYDREQCETVADKCMWSNSHGCVLSGCGFWKTAAECIGPCTWKGEGRWKGQCVTNICVMHSDDPQKCNNMVDNQCRYSLAFKRCVSNAVEHFRSPSLEARVVSREAHADFDNQRTVFEVTSIRSSSPLSLFARGGTFALFICVAMVTAAVAFALRSCGSWADTLSLQRQPKA